ncbi:hypothetical protein [Neisseria sp. Ec49-e6-T10]|uniref:hypothetical protein n=1 Tax=Neisseria sp. Ec49-e6-T10 TaxID=3140744 RepID=UPI003EB9480B
MDRIEREKQLETVKNMMVKAKHDDNQSLLEHLYFQEFLPLLNLRTEEEIAQMEAEKGLV